MQRVEHGMSILRALGVACAGVALLAIGVAEPAIADDDATEEAPLFYPAPPNQPRLQFLAKFSSVLDLSAKQKGFRNFVFGGEENEGHLVNKPYGAAVYEGAIYVVDTRGNGYGVFDVANRKSSMVQPGGAGALKKPINITIDKDGTRYVTDTGREQVVVFDSKDRFLRAFGTVGQYKPVDVAIAGNRLFLTDIAHHQIHVLDKLTGEAQAIIGEPGSEPGQLFQPTNLAIGPDDTLYVTDTGNFRIQEFGFDGEFIREIGQIGVSPGQFARPKGVALDRENRIYAVDAAFGNIQILDPLGLVLTHFGRSGAGRDSIHLPTVVKIDYDSVQHFEHYAAPGFDIEYLIIVVSQFGLNKVVVYGYGSLRE